tara:strand:- start:440 stop:547 length:108 start_codon:yes stop_codon:yes gene_type:complete
MQAIFLVGVVRVAVRRAVFALLQARHIAASDVAMM